MSGTEETNRPGSGLTPQDINLGEKLGQGVMGAVYLCRDNAGQEVAVKILHPQLATDDTVVASFVRERQLLGELSHQNVVQIKDLLVEAHQLGIVMEYVNGGTLRRRMTERRLEPREAAQMGANIAAGLRAVHGAGVVHRDLKPENVLLQDDGHGRLTPKVADFGLSRLIGGSSAKLSSTAGTALYISPEAVGRDRVGSGADVYALGAMLFEMLTGEPPFPGDDPMPIMLAHQQNPPPKLTGLPESLILLVDQMLAKDPSARPTADDVQRRLHELDVELADYAHIGVGSEMALIGDPRATVDRGRGPEIDRGPLLSDQPPMVATTQPGATSPKSLLDDPRLRIGAAVAGLLLIGLVGALLVIRPWSGDKEVAAEEISFSFAPQLYENGLVVTRQWTLSAGSTELAAELSLHNTNDAPLAAGSHFEVLPPGLAASMAEVRFSPTPNQLLSDDLAARFDYVALNGAESVDISYVIPEVEGVESVDDLEQLAKAQAEAEKDFIDTSEENIPEPSTVELAAIAFTVASYEMEIGQRTAPLQLAGEMSDGTIAGEPLLAQVSWSIDDPTVALLDQLNRVQALSVGETTVRAQVGELEATASVIVLSVEGAEVASPAVGDEGGAGVTQTSATGSSTATATSQSTTVVTTASTSSITTSSEPPFLRGLSASDLGTGHWRISAPEADRCAVASWTITGPDGVDKVETGDPGVGQCYNTDHALWTGRHYSSDLEPGNYTVSLTLTARGGPSSGPATTGFTVAGFPPTGSIPGLGGHDEDSATVVLEIAGFTNYRFETESSSTVELGMYVRSEPPAGDVVELGAPIVVYLSSGIPSFPLTPDVIGLSEADAIAALSAAPYLLTVTTETTSTADESLDGLVFAQTPAPGAEIPPDARRATIEVWRYEEPAEPPPQSPDLNGDGQVDCVDQAELLANWGTTSARHDLNRNGTVDVFDLSIMLAQWTGPEDCEGDGGDG